MSADKYASLARTLPILEWVAAVSDEEGDCMLWRGALMGGTPMMRQPKPFGPSRPGRSKRKTLGVPRMVWETINGRVPRNGRIIYRTCGNPRCINPAHLKEGKCADQKRVEVAIGRARPSIVTLARLRAIAAQKSKLSDADVAQIRREFDALPDALPPSQSYKTGAQRTTAIRAIALKFGISPGHVYALARHRTRIGASDSNPWAQLFGMAA